MPIDERAALNAAINQARLSRREAAKRQRAAERERQRAVAVWCGSIEEAIPRALCRLEARGYPGARTIKKRARLSRETMAGWWLDAEVHNGLKHRALYLGSDGKIRTARGSVVALDSLEKITLQDILAKVNRLC